MPEYSGMRVEYQSVGGFSNLAIMLNSFSSLPYPKSKLLIVLLLTVNAAIFAAVDTRTTAVDALTWLVLLVIYELEANAKKLPVSDFILERIRTGLIALIVLVFFRYLDESEWLDVANSLLWFALIAVILKKSDEHSKFRSP